MAKEVSVKRIGSIPVTELGESPFWDENLNALLYVDINKGSIHRYYPETGRLQTVKLASTASGKSVSMAVPVEGHSDVILTCVGRDIGLIRWPATAPDQTITSLQVLASVQTDKPNNKLNDGKCDSQGRLWIGTLGKILSRGVAEPGQAKLYRFDMDMKPTEILPEVTLSNGLAWSDDLKKFYWVDTSEFRVESFDYEEASGNICNRQVFYDYKKNGLKEQFPDGLTTDTDGNVWVASFNGAKVFCLDRSGKEIRSIPMPVDRPTCPCWGGKDYSTLYVTTTTLGLTPEQLAEKPDSGAVYAVTGTGGKGRAQYRALLSEGLIKSCFGL